MYRPPRIRGLADDHHEAVQQLAAELARDGLTPRERFLIDRFTHLGNRLEFEVAMGDYAESVRRCDPFGRRGGAMRKEIEQTYRVALPPLPSPPPALGDGET